MVSRRGRLNWSNLEIHISDDVIDKKHHFNAPNLFSSTSTDTAVKHENNTNSLPMSTKRSWRPKADVGEIHPEQFVGNFMLTSN